MLISLIYLNKCNKYMKKEIKIVQKKVGSIGARQRSPNINNPIPWKTNQNNRKETVVQNNSIIRRKFEIKYCKMLGRSSRRRDHQLVSWAPVDGGSHSLPCAQKLPQGCNLETIWKVYVTGPSEDLYRNFEGWAGGNRKPVWWYPRQVS